MGYNSTGIGVKYSVAGVPLEGVRGWGGAHLQNRGRETKQQCELGAFPPPAAMQIRTVTFEFRVKRCNEPLQKQIRKAPTHLDKSERLEVNVVVFTLFWGLHSSLKLSRIRTVNQSFKGCL